MPERCNLMQSRVIFKGSFKQPRAQHRPLNLTSSNKIFNVDSFSTFTDLQVPGKRDQKRKPFRSCHLLWIQAKLAQAAALPTAGVASNSFTMVFSRIQIILALTTNQAMESPWFNCPRVKMHKLGGLLIVCKCDATNVYLCQLKCASASSSGWGPNVIGCVVVCLRLHKCSLDFSSFKVINLALVPS